MQPQFPLEILSKKLLPPAITTPYNRRKFKISSIDQRRGPVHIPYIFFYPTNDKDEASKFAERSKQLQVSLSEVLTLFYPLAGRYIQDNLLIDCNDHGVEYVEAKVACHLAPILNGDLDSETLHHLIPSLSESPTSPLLAVQCNMFECGGLAIGLRISHRVVDGFVFTKFIDGWATACRVGFGKVNRLSFDLAVFLPPRETMPGVKPVPVSLLIRNLKFVSKTFVFSGIALANLRMIAKGGADYRGSLKPACKPSRVQLVTALIWKALIRVDQAKHGQLRRSSITHMINMRGRTVLPIPDDCFGNFARPVVVRFTPDKRSNKVELHELVSLVCYAIKNAISDCAKPQNGDELFMMVEKAWREDAECSRDAGLPSYFFSSTCGMPFYPDFGWGKPTRVTRLKSRTDIAIFMMDTRDGDGIEVWIRLAENDMNLFQQDPDIRAFTSQYGQPAGERSTYLRSRC